jgi:transporter family protein
VGYLFYAGATLVLWVLWSFLGKIALRTATPVQTAVIYGVVTFAMAFVALKVGDRPGSWAPRGIWLSVISGMCGGAGLITFYLALERGSASVVVPLAGIYPVFVALLSVVLLSERLTVVQGVGIGLAIVGAILLGAGG